jgi:PEP-CTERM motif
VKIWPIITLVGLMWGSFYADGQNTGRESNPHARPHRSAIDAEVADVMKAVNQPHRPVTAYRVFFTQLLQQQDGTEWKAPQEKATSQAGDADADDGEDPGKKLFWRTTYSPIDPAQFTGWGDPNPVPDPDLVSQPACTTCRPDITFTITTTTDDSGVPREDVNDAAEAGKNAPLGNLGFGALQALNSLPEPGAGEATVLPCETMLVNGLCPLPCKGKDDPLCKSKDPTTPVLSEPGGGLIPPVVSKGGDPPPPFIGGGGGGGGGVGGGQSVGGVPEPSTWLLFGIGFLALAGFRWRFSAAR